jgi:hypothetical protein
MAALSLPREHRPNSPQHWAKASASRWKLQAAQATMPPMCFGRSPGAVSVSQRSGERGAIAYSLTTAAGCDLRQRIGQIAAERNWTLTRLTTADWDMETIFLRLTSEQRQDASAAS